MRKIIGMIVMISLCAPIFSFAQEEPLATETAMEETMAMPAQTAQDKTKDEPQKKHAKMAMMGMMGMMMKKEMVATPDGGVIVMAGDKLLKYDKNLNLAKEVEIKMDFEGMKEKMARMKEKCPMAQEMMQKEEEKEAVPEEVKE